MRKGFVLFYGLKLLPDYSLGIQTLLLSLMLVLLTGCSAQGGSFDLKGLAKSDIDLVADAHRRASEVMVMGLLEKFYKRNPRELRKHKGVTLAQRQEQFKKRQYDQASMANLNGVRGIDLIRLAFSDSYRGDRVFALMLGTQDMIDESYGGKHEFFILDDLDQQKLYHSARNLEVVAWLLRSSKDSTGKPLILANSYDPDNLNLSFERLYGRLIGNQDMLAIIISGDTQRAINKVAHSVVSMTLMPL
ncbi:hypothetical protein [Candidatus Pelagadaptatus aseana]|uniref:hypothetical protein n=1 Tax=Candidatus Pelagadaptatus aseana TaxID=3120508 RepID=UPI003C6ECCA9